MNKQRTPISVVIIAAVLGLLIVGSVGCSKSALLEKDALKVGAILPLTGGLAFVGESCKHGIDLARTDHLAKYPNSKIQVLFEDSANDVKTGLAAFRKLKDIEGTQANFCIMSSVTGALLAQDPNQTLLVSVVSHSRITANRPRTFRYFLSSDKETKAMADHLIRQGIKTAAFLYVNDDFGQDALACFRSAFQAQEGTIVLEDSFDKNGTDVDAAVTKAIAAKPQAIYFVGYATPVAMIAKRLWELRYEGVRCSFSSFFVPPVLAQAGQAAEGVVFSSTGYDPGAPHADADTKFIRRYESTHGQKPDYYAPFSYDLATIFFESWEKAEHDLDKTLTLMKLVQNYPGVIGTASCNSERDFQFPTLVKRVRGGKASQP